MIGAIVAGGLSAPAPLVTNSYESIATANGTGSSNIITFSVIPSTYKHLQLRGVLLGSSSDVVQIAYNGDTTATNYYYHRLQGTGAAVNAASGNIRRLFDTNGSGSSYLGFVTDVLDYTNTSKYKTTRSLSGYDANGSGVIDLESNLWSNTSAITSIELSLTSGINFTTGTKIGLYGIKG